MTPDAVRALLPDATSARAMSGGDLGDAWWVETPGGDRVVKSYPDPAPGLVEAEAAGLAWLAVDGGPPVPTVHATTRTALAMDAVPAGRPSSSSAERFGRELAVLHGTVAPAFGAVPPGGPEWGFLGSVRLPAASYPDWPSLWRARTAHLLTLLPPDRELHDALDRLDARLEDVAGDPVPAARLHGDLWSGNVVWAPDRAWLVDPAAHGGHPETDLALLALFGLPELARVQAAWAESHGPADGWRERTALHQVHTLLFHELAFGGYRASVLSAVRRYL
ncbi:fructosamine kinase family protein [Rhodococcus aerolatus]